jgi:iron(III) transport system substrate-binding protein
MTTTRRGMLAGGAAALVCGRRAWAQTAAPEPSPTPLPGNKLTVYSGRSPYFQTIIDRFARTAGIDVDVRYADGTTLAAMILEEGENSPADLFFAIDESSIGALMQAGVFAPLPAATLALVDERYRDPAGLWVGTSARVRVLVHNPVVLPAEMLPGSILGLTAPAFRGMIGWAPDSSPFLSFVTAFRALLGEEVARGWLAGMQANGAVRLDGNETVAAAVASGELGGGLVNHYYAYEYAREHGAESPVVNHWFDAGDIGALVTVAAGAMLHTARHVAEAEALLQFVLAEEAQRFLADERFEYPLAIGTPPMDGLPDLASVAGPEPDPAAITDVQGSVRLLTELGIL